MNIEYVGAGAGTGKTYTVTERIGEALLNGDCDPGGLVATTYTKKAANELRQRIRAKLYEKGRPDLAVRMDEAMIGTVHSVCAKLLQRHAFAAGISPQLEVMDENAAIIVMSQVADQVASPESSARLQELAELLDQRDTRDKTPYLPKQLHAVLSQARANDFRSEDLPEMAARTADEYLALGGPLAEGDLDGELLATLDRTIASLPGPGDTTGGTKKTIRELERIRHMAEGGRLSWPAWIKLSKIEVGAKSRDLIEELNEAASTYPSHPRYQSDLREYIATVFDLARRTLEQFQAHKQERALVDYSDLEQMTYHLLRDREDVRASCAQRMQLLVVDEFQDTSPLQLALFLQLSDCAEQTLWVGDVKQSIYGFRGSDPQLVDGAVKRLREEGRLGESLTESWRSVPELVRLANELFAKPFQDTIGATSDEVNLSAVRPERERREPPLEFLRASTGEMTKAGDPRKATKETMVGAIADRVTEILGACPVSQVGVKGTEAKDEQLRDIRPADVVVLCRSNKFAKEVAGALSQRDVPASLASVGLMDTPEATLALACVRVLADRNDTLARAEVLALQSGQALEQLLADRIAYVQAKEQGVPDEWALGEKTTGNVVRALDAERAQMQIDGPCGVLDRALTVGRVWETAASWGPNPIRSAQRRANLEALRGLCRQFEDTCQSGCLSATVGGFLGWCAQLNQDNADNQAANPSPEAVQITTYHAAKGLEWPIVICAQLDDAIRDEWHNVQTVPESVAAFDFDAPLANRTLHFWPSPFDHKSNDFGHLGVIRQSEAVRRIQSGAANEALRLLYVGVTRARDRLILVTGDKVQNEWLDSLGAKWLVDDNGRVQLPDGSHLPCETQTIIPGEVAKAQQSEAALSWFPAASERTDRLPAFRTPSSEAQLESARIAEVAAYGKRMPVNGTPNESDLGNAVHSFLAFDLTHSGAPVRSDAARRLIRNFNLETHLEAQAMLQMADQFRDEMERRFQPQRVLVETPFQYLNEAGQCVSGFIDLLIETDDGWVIIDHKSYLGGARDWPDKALSYSGQLGSYAAACEALGREIASVWIHFAAVGGLVEVKLDA